MRERGCSGRSHKGVLFGLALLGTGLAVWLFRGSLQADHGGARPDGGLGPQVVEDRNSLEDASRSAAAPDATEADSIDRSLRQVATTALAGRFGSTPAVEGRTATLLATVNHAGSPASATVTFVAGPERGNRIELSPTLDATSVALFPGATLVEIQTGGDRLQRLLKLEHRRETRLELQTGIEFDVTGRVLAPNGEPRAGVSVALDGAATRTGNDGRFALRGRASGGAMLEADAPGLALHREVVEAVDGEVVALPDIALSVACTAAIALPTGAGSVRAVILPSGDPVVMRGGRLQTTWPWERFAQITAASGSVAVLDRLPSCKLGLLAFGDRYSDVASTAYALNDAPADGQIETVESPRIRGRVVAAGEPVRGAAVELRYANPVKALHQALGEHAPVTRRIPIDLFCADRQATTTDADGTYSFPVHPSIRERPYLTVTSPDERLSITSHRSDLNAVWELDLSVEGTWDTDTSN